MFHKDGDLVRRAGVSIFIFKMGETHSLSINAQALLSIYWIGLDSAPSFRRAKYISRMEIDIFFIAMRISGDPSFPNGNRYSVECEMFMMTTEI